MRQAVRDGLGSLFASDRFPEEQYDHPVGDTGLFGPGSVTWRVHADATMFVGGISALLLQTLHPLAAAAVASSSRFRQEPLHRLSRTGSFVATTTFASTETAEAVIGRVRDVHSRVRGTAPDGRSYAASDPHLLRWVHTAEVASFLAAYQRYCPRPLRDDDPDRYFAENVGVAERLGATEVPGSRAAVDAYFRAVRPELQAGEHAREMVEFLGRPIRDDPVTVAVYRLFLGAAFDLLPHWAQELHGRRSSVLDRLAVRPAAWLTVAGLRLALGPSPTLAQAQHRIDAGR